MTSTKQKWHLKPLGAVAEINPRRSSSSSTVKSLDVTFVPMAAVSEVTGAIERPEIRPFSEVAKGFTSFGENDVLFAKITPCMENGKSAIARDLRNSLGFGSTEFHVIRPGPEVIPEWIYHFVRQRTFRKEAALNFRGSAGQQRVPADFVANKMIPVPPIGEQVRLCSLIEKLLRSTTQSKSLALSSLLQASALVSSRLFEQFKDFSSRYNPVELAEIAVSSKYGTNHKCSTQPDGMPILRIPNVTDGQISLEKLKYASDLESKEAAQITLLKGDLLIVRTNGSPDLVGRCAVFDIDGTFGYASYLIRFRLNQSKVVPTFVRYFLQSPMGRDVIATIRRTSAGQYNINSTNLSAMALPLPPLEVQKEFCENMALVESLQKQAIGEHTELLNSIDHLSAAVIAQAFSGDI